MIVAVHDTITETTTITIRENERGDTIKVVQTTDRERVRNSDRVAANKAKIEVVRDTIYVERCDSVYVEKASDPSAGSVRASSWVSAMKWVFCIIIAMTVLMVIIKIKV